MKTIFIFFFLLLSIFGLSQNNKVIDNFDSIVKLTEKNYIGYSFYIKNKIAYQQYKEKIRNSIQENSYPLIASISDYLDYFKDAHIGFQIKINANDFNYKPKYLDSQISKYVGIWKYEFINFYVRLYIKDNQLIGKVIYDYRHYEDTSKIYIRVLETNTDHKFNFLISSNDNVLVYPVDILNNKIYSNGKLKFNKVTHVDTSLQNNQVNFENNREELSYKIINKNIFYLSIPNFIDITYDSLSRFIKPLHNKIIQTKYLIIDLRDNYGGSVIPSFAIAKYIAKGKMNYMGEGGFIFANDSLIKYLQEYCNNSTETNIYNQAFCEKSINYLTKFRNQIIPDTIKLYNEYNNYRFPRKVAILMNRSTSSAAELVIMAFKESSKVKLFGTKTDGAFDTGDANLYNVLSADCEIYLPAELHSTSLKRRYDYCGINPDCYIDFSKKNWMQIIETILEKN